MCTLSWRCDAGGYTVLFNRDELRTRAPGVPPREFRAGEIPALGPVDGNAGGTWIGVNACGITLALLNRYEDAPRDPPTDPVSRGLLVRELLASPHLDALLDSTGTDQLRPYRPFTLAAFAPASDPILLQWNGEAVRRDMVTTEGLVATSSGHDQAGAEAARREVFARHPAPDRSTLEALHRSHLPERGALSICMHRPDARTVSFALVTVSTDTAEMVYVPGPPCEAATPLVASLRLDPGPLFPPA